MNPLRNMNLSRQQRLILTGLVIITSTGTLAAYDTPQTVSPSSLSSEPYSETGIVRTKISSTYGYYGSGYLVNPRVVASAAHVIFDSDNLTWRTGTDFSLAFNDNLSYFNGVLFAGSTHLDSFSTAYAAYKNSSNYVAGMEDYTTLNSDFVALYALQDISNAVGNYTISYTGESPIADERWNAMLLGYPISSDHISESDQGKMFQTGPGNWNMDDIYGNNDGTATVDGVHAALYQTDAMLTYGGNSGGPLFVYDEDEGIWTNVGQVVGSGTVDSGVLTQYHMTDENTENIIEQAIELSGSTNKLNPSLPTATSAADGIALKWSDTATNETGWQIRRNDGDKWNIIGTASANATTYADKTAEKGITYQYEIRAIQAGAHTNLGPWSKRASAAISGTNSNNNLATGLGAPYLFVTSGGDAPFYVASDKTCVVSGKIRNLQNSTLTITVIGPGVFKYTASTSTEGDNCDVLKVTLDSATQSTTSGTNAFAEKTIDITSSGSHTITFTYSKDNYSTAGDDRICLKNVVYYCSASTEAVQGGVVLSGQKRYSSWLGNYYNYGNKWVYANNLGYMYISPVSQSDWAKEQGQWVYFDQSGSSYDKLGWCWVGDNLFPWMWSYNLGWVYDYVGTNWVQESNGTWIKL
jgi:hypothetical protein